MKMSQIERFNQDLSTNKKMLEEVKALGNDLDKIVAYANSKGYNFTVADIKAKQGELSEQELDKVAGGNGGILIAW
jgi:predicted ribosomally synthesized peptide with nif11-like leader